MGLSAKSSLLTNAKLSPNVLALSLRITHDYPFLFDKGVPANMDEIDWKSLQEKFGNRDADLQPHYDLFAELNDAAKLVYGDTTATAADKRAIGNLVTAVNNLGNGVIPFEDVLDYALVDRADRTKNPYPFRLSKTAEGQSNFDF